MTMTSTDILADCIAEKLRRLSELRDLGLRQLDVIKCNETGRLFKILAAKQHLIERLHEIERRLDPFRDQDPAGRRWASEDARQLCARQADLCRRLIDEIVLQEQNSELQLAECRDEVAARLERIHNAAQVHAAYLAQDRSAAPAVDIQSQNL